MSLFKFLFLVLPVYVLNIQSLSYADYEKYLNENLNIENPLMATYILMPVNMCNTCLVEYIQTLNNSDFNSNVNLVAIGSNKKLTVFKIKHLDTSKLPLYVDFKNTAIQKNLCSKEKIVFVFTQNKNIKVIDYDDFDGFKKLLNEI